MDIEKNHLQNNLNDVITRRDYSFVALWAAGIILLYIIIGYFGIGRLESYKSQTELSRQEWMNAAQANPDANLSDFPLPAGAKPVDVNVGICVNQIGEFSLRDNKWTADFDIWFKWKGDDVNPGKNFKVVNGQIEQSEKKESYMEQGQLYERYHVQARIVKYFDASRFPFSDEGLTIQIEDGVDDIGKVRYVADKQDVTISDSAVRKFVKITKSGIWIKLHNYAAIKKVHSRFIFAMLILPPGLDLYIKMFQALFASVAIASIVLFIKPIHADPRFGLSVGGFFAAVGNNIYLQSYLPVSDKASLVDMVNGIGLGTIFLILVQSAVSLYIFDTKGQEKFSRFFDKASFVVFLLCYVIINLLLPLAAGV